MCCEIALVGREHCHKKTDQGTPKAHVAGPLGSIPSSHQSTILVTDRRFDRGVNCAEMELRGQSAGVDIISRQELRQSKHWQYAFASQHKDWRYYEIVEETVHPQFDYLYFAIRDSRGEIEAVQPFFLLDQDILFGIRPCFERVIDAIRLQWPRFMYVRTMMVGCVAGEGHLDDGSDSARAARAKLLAKAIVSYARALGARLIVLKEFPKRYREALSCFVRGGFAQNTQYSPDAPQRRLYELR
jgi:hypothetical protein